MVAIFKRDGELVFLAQTVHRACPMNAIKRHVSVQRVHLGNARRLEPEVVVPPLPHTTLNPPIAPYTERRTTAVFMPTKRPPGSWVYSQPECSSSVRLTGQRLNSELAGKTHPRKCWPKE